MKKSSTRSKNHQRPLLEKTAEAKKLVTEYGYVDWLETFTESHPEFRDDDFLCDSKGLSEDDLKNVRKLSSFSRVLSESMFYSCLPVTHLRYGYYVRIKRHEIAYEIGTKTGQKAYSYVERKKTGDDYTDFEDIFNGVMSNHSEAQIEKLKRLQKVLDELKELEVPKERVAEFFEKYDLT